MDVVAILKDLGYKTIDSTWYTRVENWQTWYRGKSSCQKRKRRQFRTDDTGSGSPFDYMEVTPSRFLDEIPANLVEYHEPKQLTEEETGAMFSDFLSSLKEKM